MGAAAPRRRARSQPVVAVHDHPPQDPPRLRHPPLAERRSRRHGVHAARHVAPLATSSRQRRAAPALSRQPLGHRPRGAEALQSHAHRFSGARTGQRLPVPAPDTAPRAHRRQPARDRPAGARGHPARRARYGSRRHRHDRHSRHRPLVQHRRGEHLRVPVGRSGRPDRLDADARPGAAGARWLFVQLPENGRRPHHRYQAGSHRHPEGRLGRRAGTGRQRGRVRARAAVNRHPPRPDRAEARRGRPSGD